MAKLLNRNDPSAKRWLSTGFMVGGVGAVDSTNHTLKSASMIRRGPALGHGVWVDQAFCQSVVDMGNSGKNGEKGLHARFGHPNMCADAIGTFLGKWKNLAIDKDGRAVGDLHLSSAADESPKGKLRNYVEKLAVDAPLHFGASIVFTQDMDAMCDFVVQNGGDYVYGAGGWGEFKEAGRCKAKSEIPEGMDWYVDMSAWKSPDSDNVENLPHARCAELHAADLVDDPAATDGMFSGATGVSLAGQMTEWLDLHPQVFSALQEPGLVEMLERYHDRLGPFIERYRDNASKKSLQVIQQAATDLKTEGKPDGTAVPAPAEVAASTPTAEPVKPNAETDSMMARIIALDAENKRLTGELSGATTRAETAETALAAMTTIRDEIAGRLSKAESEIVTLKSEHAEAGRKLAAYESGQPPVSSMPAPIEGNTAGTLMERARASKK